MWLHVFLIAITDCYCPASITGVISMLLFGTLINELKNFTSLTTYLGSAEKTPNCLSICNWGVKAYTPGKIIYIVKTLGVYD